MARLDGILILMLMLILALWGCQTGPPAAPSPTGTPTSTPPSTPIPSGAGDAAIGPTGTLSLTQAITGSVQIEPLKAPSECPKLESRLRDLARAENPEAFARTHALTYNDGLTRAIVELQTPQPDLSFLDAYDAEVETQAGDAVQIMVPVESLCALSQDPKINFVRSPLTPVNP